MSYVRDLVFDVGLHCGEDTDFYLKCGYCVVAFEANPDLVDYCRRRFAQEIRDKRLHIVAGAITGDSTASKVSFFVNSRLTVWGTISEEWAERNRSRGCPSARIEVDTVDLPQAFRTFGVPYYLKIDIEGADQFVLDALRRLPDRPRFISLESDINSLAAAKATIAELQQLGYARFKAVQQVTIPGSAIRVQSLGGDRFDHEFEDGASGPFGEQLLGSWYGGDECLRAYEEIFRRYRRFGHLSAFAKHRVTRIGLEKIQQLGWIEIPGWHDLHAELA
jgi:FkbM family methyltransferase